MNRAEGMFSPVRDTELGVLRTLLLVVFVLAVPIALITTTVRAAISEQRLYDYSVREFDAEGVSGIPEPELIRANAEIREYLVGDASGPLSITITDASGEEAPLFSAREVGHMADVRDLVRLTFSAQVISLVIVLSLAVIMIALWPVRVLAAGLLYGAFFTGAVFATVAILALTGFDSAWSQFHGLAFTNDLWRLDPDTDHLIQMFPEKFWFQATALIAAAVLLEAVLMASLACALLILVTHKSTVEAGAKSRPQLPGRAGHSRLPAR